MVGAAAVARIPEAYQWLLVPGQPDPRGALEWTQLRLQGAGSLAKRASKKLKNEEMLLIQMGGVRLRLELDRVPLWRGDDVPVKQLIEDVATYLYARQSQGPNSPGTIGWSRFYPPCVIRVVGHASHNTSSVPPELQHVRSRLQG